MSKLLCVVSLFVFAAMAGCVGETDVASNAQAVTWGELDGEDHPYVGLLVFDVDGQPAWRCTGTLLSPTVMVTAGHCTFGASGGRVWFESNVQAGWPGNGYPFTGDASVEFVQIATHPSYVDDAFYLHDLGGVILSEPVVMAEYGTLAEVGHLDDIATARGRHEQHFTPVGYGLQSVVPEERADLIRHRASVRLISVRGTAGIPRGGSVMFTNNAATGGTCFGDSGGPVFVHGTNEIVAITSFGLNPNCVGTGGGYRIDTVDDQALLNRFLP